MPIKFVKIARWIGPWVAVAVIVSPGGACVVDGQCFGDGDCEGGRICRAGRCVFDCTTNDDCGGCRRCEDRRCTECCQNSDCADDEQCVAEVCVPAPGCLGCGQLDHGTGVCLHGICIVAACEQGYHDVNGDHADGCEYACVPTGGEVCNELDDDCDGRVDEDFNLARDVENCGGCNVTCEAPPHAEAVCAGGDCYYQCDPGYFEVNGDPADGCESDTCEPTAGGVEICDLFDNDCNGEVDEGFAKDTVQSCGPVCQVCAFDHATAECVGGACVLVACDAEYHDWDRDPDNGCEAHCVPTDPPDEVCDDVDNDCDGLVDEGLVCSCPAGMVVVESAFCIDVYEASHPDATASSTGSATEMAISQPGVMPWRNVSFADAAGACARAGKRLCEPAEWEQACRGPAQTTYCYGDTYEPLTCNGIDSFEYPTFHLVPTGTFTGCTNAYGVYDINGNIWERVQPSAANPAAGSAGRGGAFNCSDSAALHKCGYEATWGNDPVSNFGFRCCL
jgi:hypothetical protein